MNTQKTNDGTLLSPPTCYPDVVPLDDYWMKRIPDDNYKLETSLVKGRQSTPDSLAGGHWTWIKMAVGYRGEITGVLLSLDWAEALEFQG